MPLYEITTKDETTKRLVEADSASAAIRHCANGRYSARTIQKPSEVAGLMANGTQLEVAGVELGQP